MNAANSLSITRYQIIYVYKIVVILRKSMLVFTMNSCKKVN